MKKLSIEKKVLKIVNKITGFENKSINPNGNLKDELNLDSIQLVELFAMLENEFGIELPLKMMTVKTGKEFLDILEESLQEQLQVQEG